MKAILHDLAPIGDKARDVTVGFFGTGIAVSLQGWQSYASIFAAASTGFWMLTQAFIAIKNRIDARKK